jgi:hypothetical protein
VRFIPVLANVVIVFGLLLIASSIPSRSFASDIPGWLRDHVGDGVGQIDRVVLQRARALYLQKVSEGEVRNGCYFAMDATRPNDSGGRFYIICESRQVFRAIAAGHGGGRDLGGRANFANGRECARNFGNAMDSDLTAGGSYVTAETKTSFKGYYRVSGGYAAFIRSFLQFNGEGETADAREREIGGHASATLKGICLLRNPESPHANPQGYVPLGNLVDYTGGRSNGCTSWSPSDAQRIMAMASNNPTTLYIYPGAADIVGVAHAVAAGMSPSRAGLYWNASCLRAIGAPRFWSRESLEPIIAEYKRDHPAPPPRPAPICRGQ